MAKGYRIIEFDLLDPVISSSHEEMGVALLDWMSKLISLELGPKLQGASVEVIKVTYLGSYPALGVHHPDSTVIHAVAPLVEKAGTHILETHSIAELLRHMETKDWWEATKSLMNDDKS
jgi:hypothetical protein